jgi:sterol desaturase/sphingolipid hydroxylase (fatty acid hydroxylase superfamily)
VFRYAESFGLQHQGSLIGGLLLLAFVGFAVWETFRPRRASVAPTGRRWLNHATLWFLCNVMLWLYRASGVVVAIAVSGRSYGLLNREILPFWARFTISVLLLDLLRYAQHRTYHAIPVLWRIHQVHHADQDYDWSTGLRFHPLEALLTQGSYLALIAALAPPPLAVLCVELADIVLNFFEHANVAVPSGIDTRLRRFLVTPDMHRIHHSEEVAEQNTNFGTIFPWWDRLFGTYIQEPAAGRDKMRVGLRGLPAEGNQGLLGMLALPFKSPSR